MSTVEGIINDTHFLLSPVRARREQKTVTDRVQHWSKLRYIRNGREGSAFEVERAEAKEAVAEIDSESMRLEMHVEGSSPNAAEEHIDT